MKRNSSDDESILTDFAYYLNDKEGIKKILFMCIIITVFGVLCFIPVIHWLIVIIFGLSSIVMGYKLFQVYKWLKKG